MKYICTNCESEFLKWSGKCPTCGEWGTLEEVEEEIVNTSVNTEKKDVNYKSIKEFNIKPSSNSSENRFSTGYSELDRVLGGGLVGGEVVLVSGEPGIGKSTILLQVAINLIKNGKKILYVCGEESPSQLYSRFNRGLGNSWLSRRPGHRQSD